MGLRKRFQLDTRLHRQIGRVVHRVVTRWMLAIFKRLQIGCHRNRRQERERARPGIIMAVQYHIPGYRRRLFSDGNYFALGFWD